jgi:hypothetical protein
VRLPEDVIPSFEFDIFKTDKDGHLVWCAAASTLEDAKLRASALAVSNRCEFVIFSQKTGTHISFTPKIGLSTSPE